jgi:hypothetical protein
MKRSGQQQRDDDDPRSQPVPRDVNRSAAKGPGADETQNKGARKGRRKERKSWLVPGVIALGVIQTAMALVGLVILLHRWAVESRPAAQEVDVRVPVVTAVPAEDLQKKEPAKKTPTSRPTPTAAPTPTPKPQPAEKASPSRPNAGADSLTAAGLRVRALLTPHLQPILGAAYAPDGRHFVTTSRDGSLRLWDLSDSEPALLYEGNEQAGALASPTFSPDGRLLAVASVGRAIVYDCSGETLIRRVVLPECMVAQQSPFPEQVLGFFPDGQFLAVGFEMQGVTRGVTSVRSAANVWFLGAAQPVITTSIRNLTGRYDHCMAISSDRRLTGTLGGQGVKWTTIDQRGKEIRKGLGMIPDLSAKVASLAYSPNGNWLAMTTMAGSVALHNVRAAGAHPAAGIEETPAHAGWATVIGFTPGSRTFVTRGKDQRVIWWEATAAGKKLREWQTPADVELWRFSPDGRVAALLVPGNRIALVQLAEPFQQP